MTQRRIIGLMGAAGSGKDAVAAILCRDFGFTRVAFADKLKAMAIDRGWSGRKDDEGRRLLQDLGIEVRLKDPTHWIREALRTMDGIRGPVVISDVRFRNEISTLEGMGARLWWIERDGVGPVNGHVSEYEWRSCTDATLIMNNGTLDDLAETVAREMEGIGKG